MIKNKFLVASTGVFILSLITLLYLYLEIGGEASIFIATISSLLPLCLVFLVAKNKSVISPIGFYIISVLVFILSRPIISLFTEIDIVEAGIIRGAHEVSKAIYLIGIGVATTGLFMSLPVKYEKYDKFLFKPVLGLPDFVRNGLLYSSVALILVFLYKSYGTAQLIGQESYFSILESNGIHEHLKIFFLSKMILTLYLLSSSEHSRHTYFWCSFLLFVGSLGFIMIGLRGYTIAYFTMFLFFLNERKKISMIIIIPIGMIIIYLSALVLEYRLGFSVFNNTLEMLYLPFGQQGATFEVVYGAANFMDKIRSCISYYEYFHGGDFGGCVDLARGVGFASGGFASSYFAEGLYFGHIVYIFLCAVMGIVVKYLDHISAIRMKISLGALDSSRIGFMLFCILPNLVYFARSSSFDFLLKFILTSIVIVVYAFFFERQGCRNDC